MRFAHRAIGIVAAAVIAVAVGWSASPEEPKPAEPGSQGDGPGPMPDDDVRVKPGGHGPLVPKLIWSVGDQIIESGSPGKLVKHLLHGIVELSVRAVGSDEWKPATAVRFSMRGEAEYTIEKNGNHYTWKACNVAKLVSCESREACGGGYGVPPELMTNVTMVATYEGSDGFKPVVELKLKGH